MSENNETLSGLEPVKPVGVTESKDTPTPAPAEKKNNEPSIRSLKTKIRKLEKELEEKDAAIAAANDKAVIFQEQAGRLKADIEGLKREHMVTLTTIRGVLVNDVNVIDALGGM